MVVRAGVVLCVGVLVLSGCPKPVEDCTTTGTCDPPDGGPSPQASGTVVIADLSIQGHPELGRGARIDVFFDKVDGGFVPLAHVDDRNGLGVGCVGDLWSAADYAARPGADEGPVQITGAQLPMPACTFVAGQGYRCIAVSGTAQTTVIAAADSGGALTPGTAQFTLAGVTFTTNDVGRGLVLAGSTHPSNDSPARSILPIVGLGANPGTVIVADSAAVSESSAFTASYSVVAGAGPVPNGPAFLGTGELAVTLTSGGAGDFLGFTASGLIAATSFSPDSPSATLLTSIPVNGSVFSLSCEAAQCGTGSVTLTNIVTSDTPPSLGAPDYLLTPAANKVATLTCTALGTSVHVSAAASALIQQAQARHIQAVLFRSNIAQRGNAMPPLNSVSMSLGYAIAGFTVIP